MTSMATATFAVNAFRFYADDFNPPGNGPENTSTPLAAQDTNITVDVPSSGSTIVQLRLRVDEVGGASGTYTPSLFPIKNGSGTVWGTSGVDDTGGASQLTDGAATTNRSIDGISDPATGTFLAGRQRDDGAIVGTTTWTMSSVTLGAGGFTEILWAINLTGSSLSDGDVIGFNSAGTNNVAPTITVNLTTGSVTSTPGTKALTTTKFAPTVLTPRTTTPSVKALTTTKFAPVVSTPRNVVPSTKAILTSTFAPTAVLSDHKRIVPNVNSLVLTTFSPTTLTDNSETVIPDKLTLLTTLFSPNVSIGIKVIPDVTALTASTFSPTIRTPVITIPSTTALTATTFAAATAVGIRVSPDVASLTTNKFAPIILTPFVATPATATLSTTSFSPELAVGVRVTPLTASLVTDLFNSDVLTPRLVTPGVYAFNLTTFAPTATVAVPPVFYMDLANGHLIYKLSDTFLLDLINSHLIKKL